MAVRGMGALAMALRVTPTLGFVAGALSTCPTWSGAWPQLSAAAALRGGMMGWLVGLALAPLASRLRRGDISSPQRPGCWWGRVACVLSAVVAMLPAGLWVAAAPPSSRVREALFPKRAAGDRPNLILITVDALRKDHLGVYGSRAGLTPNLDAFAREATVYREAYVSSPWTLTSFASMFTSLPPSECGVKSPAIESQEWYEHRASWPREVTTVAERLEQAGYGTAAEVTNPFLLPVRGCAQGFSAFRNESVKPEFGLEDERAEWVTRNAVAWLRLNRRRPFFLWVHYLDPHCPYDAPTTPRALRGRYPAEWVGARRYRDAHFPHWDERTRERFREFCRLMYAEEVRYADHWVGRLLEAIRAQGLYDDSLIVITADHGEELFDHGGIDHGHSMYSEVLSVPLLVKWPRGTPADAQVNQTVAVSGLVATLLEAARVKDRRGVKGEAFPRKDGGAGEEVYAEALLYGEEQTALVGGRWKVIYHPFAQEAARQFEVYDLRDDPGERRNLAETGAAAHLRERLRKYTALAQAAAQRWQERRAQETSRARVSEDALRRLRALGYVGK